MVERTATGRVSKKSVRAVKEYITNQCKWKAAREFCESRNWEFQILTEKELKV